MIIEAFIIIAALALLYYKLTERQDGLPPGDWGYPIVGKLPKTREDMMKLIDDQRKKYGDLFSIKIGSTIVIFISDFNLLKTAFSKFELSGRPTTRSFNVFTFQSDYGLVFANGHVWQENRRFAIRTLKDFGLGKSRLQEIVEIEVAELLKELATRVNKPTKIDWFLNVAVLNVIWQLTASKRYDIHDKEIYDFWDRILKIFVIMGGQLTLLDFMPWLEKIVPRFLINYFINVDELEGHVDYLRNYFENVIEEHKKTFDKTNNRDYIDAYLRDLEDGGAKDQNAYKNDIRNLSASMLNLFAAGADTISSTLRWYFLYLCKYPEIQERIQSDIDSVTGRDRLPSLEDKDKMAYFEASLYEISRISSLVPNGVIHEAMEDAELGGYKIPKGALIFPCLDLCHMNPEYFDSPEEFRPERFLDSNGKLLTKKEGYVPFSIGRRLCLGEPLAKMELFTFGAGILQKFKVSIPEDEVIDLTPERYSFFNYPRKHNIIFTER